MNKQYTLKLYRDAIKAGPAVAGVIASCFDDEQCEYVYNEISKDKQPKLVKTLWFNYKTQQFRAFSLERN